MTSDLKLISSLKRLYWLITGPAMLIFACLLVVRCFNGLGPDSVILQLPEIWHAVLFTSAAFTAIAGPVLLRVMFAHRESQQTRVEKLRFEMLQRRLIIVSCITPYTALAAVCCGLSEFHAGGIILMALYGVYYHFPSKKRINHDIKLFRVK